MSGTRELALLLVVLLLEMSDTRALPKQLLLLLLLLLKISDTHALLLLLLLLLLLDSCDTRALPVTTPVAAAAFCRVPVLRWACRERWRRTTHWYHILRRRRTLR